MNDHDINRHLAKKRNIENRFYPKKNNRLWKCVTRYRWQSAMRSHERTGQCDRNDEEKFHCLVFPI